MNELSTGFVGTGAHKPGSAEAEAQFYRENKREIAIVAAAFAGAMHKEPENWEVWRVQCIEEAAGIVREIVKRGEVGE